MTTITEATSLLGRDPATVTSAPGRVNLIGEHTDYNDGFVLPFALAQRVVVVASPRRDGLVSVRSTNAPEAVTFPLDTQPGGVTGWAGYVAGVVWALREAGAPLEGADLAVASDVPLGSGLSSSAALESAVALAFGGDDLPIGRAEDRAGLATLAQRAENDYVGMPCGVMDQSASLRATKDHLLLLDCRSLAVRQVPFPLADHGLELLVIDSRAPHQLVDGEYAARRDQCEQAAAALGVAALRDATPGDVTAGRGSGVLTHLQAERAQHVTTENHRVIQVVEHLESGVDIRVIGPLLTESHASMRDRFEITVDQVDLAVDVALDEGAHGARMTGGGFGGCIIALVDRGRSHAVAERVAEAFASRGYEPPVPVSASPSGGALVHKHSA